MERERNTVKDSEKPKKKMESTRNRDLKNWKSSLEVKSCCNSCQTFDSEDNVGENYWWEENVAQVVKRYKGFKSFFFLSTKANFSSKNTNFCMIKKQ
jgi:hypothetical protein